MTIARTRTFRSGNSEAVRLPKEVAFGPDVELTLVRSGEVLTIYPARTGARALVAALRDLPAPAALEVRDDGPPERPGL